MASDLNMFTFTGNLVADVEHKELDGDNAVGNFRVANNTRKKKGDEGDSHVNFVQCAVWGAYAKALAPYLKKGTPVSCTGRMEMRQYTKDDVKHTVWDCTVDQLKLGNRGNGNGNGSQKSAVTPAESTPAPEGDKPPF